MNAHRFRLVVFVLITALMIGGPIYRQVFGGTNKIFRNWVMSSGRGIGDIDARFTQLFDDGSEVELDRIALLGGGRTNWRELPRNTWRIRKRYGGAMEVARRLCGHLDQGSKIKVYARLATREGWRVRYDGKQVVCDDALQ